MHHNLFTLVEKEVISKTVNLYRFKHNSQLLVKNFIPGTLWIGRHFTIKFINGNKQRLYTTVLCMTQENIKLRKAILDYS